MYISTGQMEDLIARSCLLRWLSELSCFTVHLHLIVKRSYFLCGDDDQVPSSNGLGAASLDILILASKKALNQRS